MPELTDDEIAANLREAVGKLNHFCHVAHYHGLFVQLTGGNEVGRTITDVCVMRPILPGASRGETP